MQRGVNTSGARPISLGLVLLRADGPADAAKLPGAKLVRDTQVFASAPASMRLEVNETEKDASITQNFATIPGGDFTVLLKAKATGTVTVKLIAQQFNAISYSPDIWVRKGI